MNKRVSRRRFLARLLAAPAAAVAALNAQPSARPLGLVVTRTRWEESGSGTFRMTVEFVMNAPIDGRRRIAAVRTARDPRDGNARS